MYQVLKYLNKGSYIERYISQILELLIIEVGKNPNSESYLESLKNAVISIDEELVKVFIKILATNLSDSRLIYRKGSAIATKVFFKNSTFELSEEITFIVEPILYLFNDPQNEMLQIGLEAFTSIIDSIQKEQLPNYVINIREVLKQITENSESNKIIDLLPGINIEKGLEPFIKLYQVSFFLIK
jgi:hypothetical protein